MYSLRLQLFARVESLDFTADDLLSATPQAFADLIAEMEKTDPQEAQDQVHESYMFHLCAKCRGVIHRLLKMRAGRQKETS